MTRLTIIGAGNIGGATALGLHGAADITVTARSVKTLSRFDGTGIRTSTDNASAVRGADVVVFAVKPWQMEEVVKSVLPFLNLEKQTIVSMAPGVKSRDFLDWLGNEAYLAYVIPNTAIEFKESLTFIVPVTATASQAALLASLFENAGKTMTVNENMLAAGTSLASCGIAYALRYIQASVTGGVQCGFDATDAVKVVTQTVKGACALLDARGTGPEEEISKVTTPGGMTLKGLESMEAAGFSAAVIEGIKANG